MATACESAARLQSFQNAALGLDHGAGRAWPGWSCWGSIVFRGPRVLVLRSATGKRACPSDRRARRHSRWRVLQPARRALAARSARTSACRGRVASHRSDWHGGTQYRGRRLGADCARDRPGLGSLLTTGTFLAALARLGHRTGLQAASGGTLRHPDRSLFGQGRRDALRGRSGRERSHGGFRSGGNGGDRCCRRAELARCRQASAGSAANRRSWGLPPSPILVKTLLEDGLRRGRPRRFGSRAGGRGEGFEAVRETNAMPEITLGPQSSMWRQRNLRPLSRN